MPDNAVVLAKQDVAITHERTLVMLLDILWMPRLEEPTNHGIDPPLLMRSGMRPPYTAIPSAIVESLWLHRSLILRPGLLQRGLGVKASLQWLGYPPALWAGHLPSQCATMGQEPTATASVATVGPLPKEVAVGASTTPPTGPTGPLLDGGLLREGVHLQNVQRRLDPEGMGQAPTSNGKLSFS